MALYAFDGTWNERKDAGEYDKNTNVVKFYDLYLGNKHFYQGVGTKHGFLGRLFGGAFGAGGKDRIKIAMADLERNIKQGDTDIDIIGFSRGAALALHFSYVVAKKGHSVRFLGLWDTVASFGIPINIAGIPFNHINLGYELKLHPGVRYCYHALALDEQRAAFRPTRIVGAIREWYKGVHSDVGGGNENEALSNISLVEMLKRGEVKGLLLDMDAAGKITYDASALISDNDSMMDGKPRDVLGVDVIHWTAK